MIRVAPVVAVALLVVRAAFAGDGVTEINQAIAVAGGVNGDLVAAPPVSWFWITQPGSYRLTGNLTIPLGSSGIQIDSINVTLDMGGFVVSGANACSANPLTTCTHSTTRPAIVSGQFLVAVRNGTIIGSEGGGVQLLGASSEIDQLRVIGCGGLGYRHGRLRPCLPQLQRRESLSGIRLADGGLAENNESRANGGFGITMPGGSIQRLSTAIVGNRAFDNALGGIFVPAEVMLSGNVASDNASAQIAGGLSRGDNSCAGTFREPTLCLPRRARVERPPS